MVLDLDEKDKPRRVEYYNTFIRMFKKDDEAHLDLTGYISKQMIPLTVLPTTSKSKRSSMCAGISWNEVSGTYFSRCSCTVPTATPECYHNMISKSLAPRSMRLDSQIWIQYGATGHIILPPFSFLRGLFHIILFQDLQMSRNYPKMRDFTTDLFLRECFKLIPTNYSILNKKPLVLHLKLQGSTFIYEHDGYLGYLRFKTLLLQVTLMKLLLCLL